MNAIPSAHLIPRYPPHVHTGTWGTLETFTPAVRANKVCTARRAKRNTQLSWRPRSPHLHAEHDAPDHGHGRDQAVPGPADSLELSRAVKVETSQASTSRSSPARSRTRRTRVCRTCLRAGLRCCRYPPRSTGARSVGRASANLPPLLPRQRPLLPRQRPRRLRRPRPARSQPRGSPRPERPPV